MCFSTKASFGAAVVLTGIGIVAFSKAKTSAQKTVALMPLLFAAQQFSEGILWISLIHPEYGYLKKTAMYTFLVFAEMVWPLYMPFISLQAEQDPERRRKLKVLFVWGSVIVLTLIYGLVAYPVNAEIREGHIWYNLQYPLVNYWYYGLIYFLPTIAAPVITSLRSFRLLGATLLVSYIFSRIFYSHYVISIWCYFGALLSIIAIAMIREMAQGKAPEYQTSRLQSNV